MLLLLALLITEDHPIPADLVVTNANIITLTGKPATAMVITGGRISYVGNDVGAKDYEAPRKLDLKGATVIPGLVDAHAHLRGLGRDLEILDLRGCKDQAELVQRVKAAAAKTAPGKWIEGRGWDQNQWPDKRFPTHAALSAVTPEWPVMLTRVDGHAVFVNARAMAVAKIDDKTTDPAGGRILRDEKGAATGVFIDAAEDLIERWVPPQSRADIERQILAAQDKALSVGLTGLHDMGTTREELAVLRAIKKKLRLRIYVALDGKDEVLLAEEYARGPQVDPMLTVRAVKLYADGALGSRGAALLAPYSDDPTNRGLQLISPDALDKAVARAKKAGFQVCTHAIGDGASRSVLDAYAKVAKPEDRYRIEHAQVVDPVDWPRFAKLGVIASMQPTHATSDMPWAERRLGPQRIAGAYAWRSLTKAGAQLAFGSDFPVELPDPLFGIYSAITRADHEGRTVFRAQEALSAEEAIRAFTVGAAFASFTEATLGTLEKGKLADFVVLSVDPLKSPPKGLLTASVTTYVNGR